MPLNKETKPKETEMCWQIDEIFIGSPLGPFLANIFQGFHGKSLLDKFPKPYCYGRYVDDSFASFFSCDEAIDFFQKLNNLQPSLKFTMQE